MSITVPVSQPRPLWGLGGLWRSRTTAFASRLASYRRGLQIALGLIWLLDAALQYQPYMFSKDFVTQIIEPVASGNPMVVSHPITWSAHIMLHHVAVYNAVFATIQLLLALGILWPRTLKAALAASVVWSIAVWWFGEGLGGILTSPTSDPFTGAPGAVILYAFIAILIWPRGDKSDRPAALVSVAETSPIGATAANVAWLGLWASFVYMMLEPVNRSPHSLGSMVTGMSPGEPGWVKSINSGLGNAIGGNGTAITAILVTLFVLVGLGVFIPRLVRPAVIVAVLLGAFIWVTEDFGGIFTAEGTDVNSGLLVMLLAAVYWPVANASKRTAQPTPETPFAASDAS